MSILLAVAVLALIALTASNVFAVRAVVLHRSEPTKPVEHPVTFGVVDVRLTKLESDLDRLTLAVSDGIERVHRAESRIAKTVTSARRLVRDASLEHAAIDAEYDQLRTPDAEGIEPLPTVPAEVEEVRTVHFPGGTLEIGAA